jgi:hypothetical protein
VINEKLLLFPNNKAQPNTLTQKHKKAKQEKPS